MALSAPSGDATSDTRQAGIHNHVTVCVCVCVGEVKKKSIHPDGCDSVISSCDVGKGHGETSSSQLPSCVYVGRIC